MTAGADQTIGQHTQRVYTLTGNNNVQELANAMGEVVSEDAKSFSCEFDSSRAVVYTIRVSCEGYPRKLRDDA